MGFQDLQIPEAHGAAADTTDAAAEITAIHHSLPSRMLRAASRIRAMTSSSRYFPVVKEVDVRLQPNSVANLFNLSCRSSLSSGLSFLSFRSTFIGKLPISANQLQCWLVLLRRRVPSHLVLRWVGQ